MLKFSVAFVASLLLGPPSQGLVADPAPDEVLGNYASLAGTSSHGASYLLGRQITIPEDVALAKFGVVIRAANSGRMALYMDDAGRPGRLVAGTALAPLAAGRNEISPEEAVQIPAGTYWLMAVFVNSALIGEGEAPSATVHYIGFAPENPLPRMFPSPQTYTNNRHWNYYLLVEKENRNHTCLITGGSQLKCWGANQYGQLGVGDTRPRGAEPNEMGERLAAVDLGAGFVPKDVATGGVHNCALSDRGKVKCWGRNHFGQLGVGDVAARGDAPNEMGSALTEIDFGTASPVVKLALGGRHSCALFASGEVKCFGDNSKGQLGTGDVQARGSTPDTLGANLKAVDFGRAAAIVDLKAGRDHTCVLHQDGAVKCWGANAYGQLGDGTLVDRGGLATDMGEALRPVNLGAGVTAVQIALTAQSTCARLLGGEVKCFGANEAGQLGLGDSLARGGSPNDMGEGLPQLDLGDNQIATDLACAGQFCCVTLVNRAAKCWGANDVGQLGVGDRTQRGNRPDQMGDDLPFVQLGAHAQVLGMRLGNSHACVSTVPDRWRCFGGNAMGQLGLGDKLPRGDRPETVPALLPNVAVE